MKRRTRTAFTLIELMIVMVVIGILLTFLASALFKSKEQARRTQTKVELRTIGAGIRSFRHEYGEWPMFTTGGAKWTSLTGTVTVAADNWRIFEYMRDDTQNKRKITFMSWNDVFTTNSAGERVNYGDYVETHRRCPLVDAWGNAYKITLDLDQDRGIIASQTPNVWGTWKYKGDSGFNSPPEQTF